MAFASSISSHLSSASSSSDSIQSRTSEEKNSDNKALNVVFQREYLIISPHDARPIIATESVRGCYAIIMFHKEKSAILHWDDTTCHAELTRFVNEFSFDKEFLKNTIVYIAGGWSDNLESKKCGYFLVDSFKKMNIKNLNLDYFQTKKMGNPVKDQGFSLVSLDARNGEMVLSSDTWQDIKLEEGDCKGKEFKRRVNNAYIISIIHHQDDQYKDSGAHIYPRDQFSEIQELESKKLCIAARDNNTDELKKLLDEVVTNVNVSPKGTEGNTPLH